MTALRLRSLAKTFGAVPALAGVDLDLNQGEILGLLGPNGAGKSTLVRAVMGRVRLDAGSIEIFGAPLDEKSRPHVGFVPQEIALYPLLSAAENLLVFGRYLGLTAKALEDAVRRGLEFAHLAERAKTPVKQLSGGMKRRLNFAAGVLNEPRILLLDEPTVGVDPQSRERIYEMIATLRGAGRSLLYTTHYMEEAERLCDRIAVIDHGRVIAAGTKTELVHSTIGPGKEIFLEYAGEPSPGLRAEWAAAGAILEGGRLRLMTERPAESVRLMLAACEREGLAIRDLRLVDPTLERVFLHLTGRELRE